MTDHPLTACILAIDEAEVQVRLPATVVDTLGKLLAPFVSLRIGHCGHQAWEVCTLDGIPNTAPDFMFRGAHHRIEAPGEPAQDAWLDIPAHRIVVVCRDQGFLPLVVTRLASHLLRIACLGKDHLFMHAAAVACRGRAMVLAGPKKSGKTTLSMSLMQRHRADFISNDNPSLRRDGDGWRCLGWPRSLRIRQDMMAALGLRAPAAEKARSIMLSHPLNCDLALPCPATDAVPSVVHVFPHELSRLYHIRLLAEAPLLALVFLDVSHPGTPPRMMRMSVDAALAGCAANMFPGIPLPGMDHAPFLAPLLRESVVPEAVSALIRDVPCYALTGALNDIARTAALLSQLFGHAPFRMEGATP